MSDEGEFIAATVWCDNLYACLGIEAYNRINAKPIGNNIRQDVGRMRARTRRKETTTPTDSCVFNNYD